MPIAKIQGPDGRIVEIEIPEGATEQQVMQFVQSEQFKQQFAEMGSNEQKTDLLQPYDEGGVKEAILEPVVQMAGGLGSSIAGGLEMLGRLPFQGIDKAIEEGQKTISTGQEFFTPKTEAGQAGSEALFDAMDQVGRIPAGWAGIAKLITGGDINEATATVNEVREKGMMPVVGEKVYQKTGSPALATIAQASPEIAGVFFTRMTGRGKALRADAKTNLERIETLSKGSPQAELAKYKLANRQKWETPSKAEIDVIADKIGKDKAFAKDYAQSLPKLEKAKNYNALAKQEWGDADIALTTAAKSGDLTAMEKMIKIYRDAETNQKLRAETRPIYEAGKPVAQRVSDLLKEKKKYGQQVDASAKALKGKQVEFEPAIDKFVAKLQDEGVVFNRGNPISDIRQLNNIDFRRSQFDASLNSQKILSDIIKRMTGKDYKIDAFDVHNLKKSLPSRISTMKKTEGGLDAKAELILNDLRRDVNDVLRESSPAYKKANTEYSKIVGTLDKFNDLMPKKDKINWEGVRPEQAGLQMRKILSNYSNATDIAPALRGMEDLATGYGYKYNNDATLQALFAMAMDRRLGTYAQGSLGGNLETAGSNILKNMPTSAGEAAAGALGKAMKKIRRVDNDRALKAMEEHIKELKKARGQ